jgi:DNA-binding Xre family transcriptional regulator
MMVRIDEQRVKLLMLVNGIEEQQELAAMAGVTPQTLNRLFKGAAFSSATLDKLAKALNCNPIDLLDTKGYPSPHMGAPALLAELAA